MKHYKVRCYQTSKETDYTSGSIFVDIYSEGHNQIQALQNAINEWEKFYGIGFDIFDVVTISFEWEDEDHD